MYCPQTVPENVVRKQHEKHCVLKGACNALAVQLFAIDERYEMRFVVCTVPDVTSLV